MIEIVVVGRQGMPTAPVLKARFGPEGGTIGRADTNTLVLDDPDRTVSRVHAQVLCRDARYFIVDRGSNPLHCNGVPLGAGNEMPLTGGERIVVGGFELAVSVAGGDAPSAPVNFPATAPASAAAVPAVGADDPFADLLQGLAPAATASTGGAAPASTPAAFMAADHSLSDPLGEAGRGEGALTAMDPFADLLGAPSTGPMASLPGGAVDDFSDLGLPAAARPTAHAQRIDELFGGMGGGVGGDPLALSPLADPLLQPNTASRDDPLAAFGQAPTAQQAARSDHLPIGQFGFTPPKGVPEPPQVPAPVPAVPVRAAALASPGVAGNEVARFDDVTGEPIRISRAPAARTQEVGPPVRAPALPASTPEVDLFDDLLGGLAPAVPGGLDDLLSGLAPAPPGAAAIEPPTAVAPLGAAALPAASSPAPAPAPAPASFPSSPEVAPPVSAHVPAPAAATKMPSATGRSSMAPPPAATQDAELLAAFLRGLGPVHQAPTTLTPALMERIGSLLRSSTEGTLQLLLTRQELKREVRAEVTMIAAQANNPLKFSPTADVALAHLLGPGIRGFMPAEAAMRDAYDDLRAHQFGVMVGMRAALERLIARFGPEELEKKIAARSALDSLFAANRKAKLWDQFNALYQTIASEAEDDFHTLFGKAFLEAYEQQMARLKNDEGRPAV